MFVIIVLPGRSQPNLKFGSSFDGIAVKGAIFTSFVLLGLLARVLLGLLARVLATFRQAPSNIQASRWEPASDRNQLAIESLCDSRIVSG